MGNGAFSDPAALSQTRLETIQYIYDSKNKNLLCKEVLDEQHTITEIWANNPHYSGMTWYTTRKYTSSSLKYLNSVKAYGDQLKVRLDLAEDFNVILKPDIIYFPHAGRAFLIKSAAMILPTDFALKPKEYLKIAQPLIANKTFSFVYLNIGSDRRLTIVHKQHYSADEHPNRSLERSIADSAPSARFEGRQENQSGSRTLVTQLECDYTILLPE